MHKAAIIIGGFKLEPFRPLRGKWRAGIGLKATNASRSHPSVFCRPRTHAPIYRLQISRKNHNRNEVTREAKLVLKKKYNAFKHIKVALWVDILANFITTMYVIYVVFVILFLKRRCSQVYNAVLQPAVKFVRNLLDIIPF